MKEDFKEIEHSDGTVTWKILPEVCKACAICIEKCPVHCLSFSETETEYLGMPLVACHTERCIACRTCENNCPEGAITVEGKR